MSQQETIVGLMHSITNLINRINELEVRMLEIESRGKQVTYPAVAPYHAPHPTYNPNYTHGPVTCTTGDIGGTKTDNWGKLIHTPKGEQDWFEKDMFGKRCSSKF